MNQFSHTFTDWPDDAGAPVACEAALLGPGILQASAVPSLEDTTVTVALYGCIPGESYSLGYILYAADGRIFTYYESIVAP